MKNLHFKAFISYSHSDEAWASWLQKSLERYRVPKRLVGSQGVFGEVPARLSPVFRDREDLSSSANLTSKIRDELDASESLIIICSPAAAQSRWVNEEIRYFRNLRGDERIFALIVDGDPQASQPEESCFPSALLEQSDGSRHEPLAADARKYADGKSLARLKLVAGILGIRLDELRRRDRQRHKRNLILSSVSAAAVIVLTGFLAFTAISSKKAAELQRTNTQDLLGYMLGNLSKLDPIVGLEVVDQDDEQVVYFLQNLGFADMDNEQLIATGLAWREEGQELRDRGELKNAMLPFQKSRAAFIELHQREGGSTRALFELGQAEFWVGYTHYDEGELDEAQESFTRYGAITRRLVNAEPNNAEWVMELSYTLINLSALERERPNADSDKALQLSQSALQYNQVALVLDPENNQYRQELSSTMAFLADAWLESCDLGRAYELRAQNVELSRQLLEESPEDDILKLELAYALSGWATVQRQISLADQALTSLRESQVLLDQLSENGVENRSTLWQARVRKQRIAWILGVNNELVQALEMSRSIVEESRTDFIEAIDSDFRTAVDYAEILIEHSVLAWRMGLQDEAGAALDEAIVRLTQLVREKPGQHTSQYQLTRARFEQWVQSGQSPSQQIDGLLDGFLADRNKVRSCYDANLAARVAVMRGDKVLARDYTSYLLAKGFYAADFVQFCKAHGICD